MTTRRCSVRNTLAPWLKAILLGAAAAAMALAAAVESASSLGRAYHDAPTPARRAALERYAASHAREANGALARLALGIAAFEQMDFPAAASHLRAAGPRLPKLADYVAYYLAAARVETKDPGVSAKDLAPVTGTGVSSPLGARAVVLEARILVAAGAGTEAARVLLARYPDLPQPEGGLALARAYEASGNLPRAAAYYQQVHYGYPLTAEATRTEAALVTLRDAMGAGYPSPAGTLLLMRADKLLSAGEYGRAREEYHALAAQLSGTERDQARVRLGAVDFRDGKIAAAQRYLAGLGGLAAEAEAERLYYLTECARKVGDEDEVISAVGKLESGWPRSSWRLKAQVAAANRFLVANRPEWYVPFYRSAAEAFPDDPLAPLCDWKAAWHAYIERRAEAGERLRGHLQKFPEHATATASLYFLGRLAERAGRWGEARAYYSKLSGLYPNYYYGLLGRDRLHEAHVADATADAQTAAFLDGLGFPPRPRGGGVAPTPQTALRIERARLLRAAGLEDLAAAELRFGARTDGQAVLLAVELGRGGQSPFEQLRYMKSMRVDYFALPLEEAPAPFWEFLFPLPYRGELVRNAQLHKLDPYTVAAVIRQESEFNPKAVSRSKAYGLTQVMPGTGRQLARKLGVRRFSSGMLFQPAVNLKLGTYYMRSLLDQWGGRWEETLAAYNAGPNRAKDWAEWHKYEEPAEFIESIPFTETREYVQAVLRNAAMYRLVYQNRPVEAVEEKAPVRKAARKAPAGTAAGRKKQR